MSGTATPGGDQGTITLWLAGLCVVLVFVGGLSLDLWRVFSERRALAGLVDAAAVAGASAIDVEHFREAGGVRLDPPLAERLAAENAAAQSAAGSLTDLAVAATPEAVTVTATGAVEPTLLKVLVPADAFTIMVTAVVEPQRSP